VLNQGTKAEAVEEEVRRWLLAGRYAPGSRLRIDAIAAELGVSHTPVKEALRRLSAQGFVTYEAHHGMRVRELNRNEAEEVYRLRIMLEGAAVERAASRLRKQDFHRLNSLQQRMRAALGRAQFRGVSSLNQELHMAIYEAADSPRLVEMIQSLWAAFPRAAYWDNRARAEISVPEHDSILGALAERDGSLARTLVEGHIARAFALVVELMAAADADTRERSA